MKKFLAVVLVSVLWFGAEAEAAKIRKVVSPGGIEAWLVEDHMNPLIAVDFAIRGGAALDPEGKAGLAYFLGGMLDEGAGPYDDRAFKAQLEDQSIQFSIQAAREAMKGRLKMLTEKKEAAFDLLRLALTEPRFDPEPMERVRAQILSGIEQAKEDPNSLAAKAWFAAMFPNHPYGRPMEGEADSVKAIAAADLRDFMKQRFAKDKLVVSVVGDITPEGLAPLLDLAFGKLADKAEGPEPPPAVPNAKGKTLIVKTDVPQSVASFGQPGISRNDPDWYPAFVLNYILGGGGFSSRLTHEVRERRGLAYSVYTYLAPMENTGVILGGVATENSRIAESIALIRAEWRRVRDLGPSEKELENAKTYLTGSFVLQLDTTSSIAGLVTAIQMDRLGIDFIEKRNDLIRAVGMADVRRVARRLYDPDALTVAVAGDPEGLTATE